ncbi:MAG: helix-turn-helix domain-containing protein [Acidobacteriota bacterium]
MNTTSTKRETSHLAPNAEALQKCQAALELRDKSDFQGARAVMHPLWERIGERPELKGLHAEVCAEVLLTVGILTSWIGSKEGIENAQEAAKNLITESIGLYQAPGDLTKVAACRAEIAYCYFREGALDEARIMLTEALQQMKVQGNTRARALLKLVVVEWSASRYNVALELLTDNAPLFRKITDDSIRGIYHNEHAIVLRHLAKSDPLKREELLQLAISEYKSADRHFQLAKNKVFRATVKNNLGLIFFNLSRFKDAYASIAEARRLAVSIKDKCLTAQFDESRAQVLIAQGKLKEAESVMRGAVRMLKKSGQQCLLAEALTTYGIALARSGKRDQAQFNFQRAMEIGHQVGALNKAGLAALTLIEEIADLAPDVLNQAHDRAIEWLATSQSQEVLQRVIAVTKKIRANSSVDDDNASGALLNTRCDLTKEKLKHERELIRQALAKVDGRLTRAASLLGMTYQGLAYIIEKRHPDLLKERSPIRRRSN